MSAADVWTSTERDAGIFERAAAADMVERPDQADLLDTTREPLTPFWSAVLVRSAEQLGGIARGLVLAVFWLATAYVLGLLAGTVLVEVLVARGAL